MTTGDPQTREALRQALRHAETEVRRAQTASYYAHRTWLQSRTPQAGAGFREASARTERAVAALGAADKALAEAEKESA